MAEATFVLPAAFLANPTAASLPWTIASVPYIVDWTWDNRATGGLGAWRLTWRDPNGDTIFSGKKLVLTDDFFEPLHYKTNLPSGRLVVERGNGGTADPGLNDLDGVIFKYVTED